MPRKSKDELDILDNEKINKKESSTKKSSTKRTSASKKAMYAEKVEDVKAVKERKTKRSSKKVNAENITEDVAKKSEKKTTSKASKTAKTDSTKTSKNKTTKSSKTAKSTSSTLSKKKESDKTTKSTELAKSTDTNVDIATKKKIAKKASTKKVKSNISNIEYYDLPYRYNQTVVRILAQTPTNLFVYWDISDEDRKSYIKKYGEDFFNNTKPVLIITNKTMNYTFEIEINDFANSWYVHLNDANCDYSVELGRRPIYLDSNIDKYVYISTSNDMEMPNNHILFDKLGKSVFFRNIKNNFVEEKEVSSISFIKNIGKVYNIYELYQEIYKNEIEMEELNKNNIKLNLSSSNGSTFK